MATMNFPFTINPILSAVALAYTNNALIADRVLPRVPVSKPQFLYLKYGVGDGFTIPNTMVGRTSRPNQVEYSVQQVAGTVNDHALDIPVPQADIEAAAGTQYDPKSRATQLCADLIALDREKRVADAVFNAANFASANKATLSGTGQWSDPASDPLRAVMVARDGMIMRPTKLVIGQDVATQLQLNPNVVSAVLRNPGTKGVAPLDAIANMLGLDEIVVGMGWVNTAKPGQTPTLARLWGKFAALLCLSPLANNEFGTTFGYTAQWGSRIAGEIQEPNMGMRGGVNVRVGESVGEIITAADLGFLWSAAVA